ncbi:hypothetical protein [uncultured Nitratireductor sp.]|uniref:hypothetical protein n=1 Tax=uncultured Nitratireductor sp. TaxID=520953 RepID=UPI0026320D1D|nr:hypothetical protein [uncultured Nitratireductor sp.]
MSKKAHTPGPWHRNIKPARRYPTVWAGRNTHIAAVVAGAPYGSGNGETMSDEEMEANIDLIAAAPDLLEALENMLRVAEMTIFFDHFPVECEIARAALSKATGGAS